MKTHEITIQYNRFNAIQVPTTQEDNYADIIDKYDLFYKHHNEVNGNETSIKVGHLVRYQQGYSIVWHDNQIRYIIPQEDIVIRPI